MNQTSLAIIGILNDYFADTAKWPQWRKPLHLLQGVLLVQGGQTLTDAARAVKTTTANLKPVLSSRDPVEHVLNLRDADLEQEAIQKLKRKIGELLLARAAEIAFENICKAGINPGEFSLTDLSAGRNNTDFRLWNGGGKRELYRFNVKFFGSLFENSQSAVGLASSDCFPLATYKLLAALETQQREHLPYVFAVVGVAGLNAQAVAEIIPQGDVRPIAMLRESGRVTHSRDFEDWLVGRIVKIQSPAFATAYDRIRNAEWYVLSAHKASLLMHKLLFDRVFALRVPGFTRRYKGAEVDMHFSISQDMVPLPEFLSELGANPGKVTHMLADGAW